MKQGIAEILKTVSSKKTKKDRIEELRKHADNNPLRLIVALARNPDIKWRLPEGEPPYTPANKDEDLQGILIGKVRKLGMFLEGSGQYKNLPNNKVETLFIQALESMDPDDAQLLIHAKDKKFPFNGITDDVIENAWPGFTSTWRDENGKVRKS